MVTKSVLGSFPVFPRYRVSAVAYRMILAAPIRNRIFSFAAMPY